MFAVSANARQLLIARPRAPASARGSSRRVAAAARPAAASSSARASDVEATTGAGARAMRAGAALALSAAVAFSSPGPALAALNKKGNSQDAYAEMMDRMPEVHYLDVAELLRQRPSSKVMADPVHPSLPGARIIALRVAEELRTLGVLDAEE